MATPLRQFWGHAEGGCVTALAHSTAGAEPSVLLRGTQRVPVNNSCSWRRPPCGKSAVWESVTFQFTDDAILKRGLSAGVSFFSFAAFFFSLSLLHTTSHGLTAAWGPSSASAAGARRLQSRRPSPELSDGRGQGIIRSILFFLLPLLLFFTLSILGFRASVSSCGVSEEVAAVGNSDYFLDISEQLFRLCAPPVPQVSVPEENDAVTGHIISTTIGGKNGEPKQTISYMAERVVGTGSFGIVFQAKCLETGETVAIKKVLQDRKYKNRELQLMRSMDHSNVISLKHCFFSTTSKDELFLNLVMEYVPETLYRVLRHYSSVSQRMPLFYVKLYTYQLFRGLAYIHTVPGICHRDVKPQNVLVDPHTHQVKLCDFGSAKVLVKGEPNISYICSRYYRAPELIFGAIEYGTSIDIWSAGCVLAELLLGQPLFPGESAVDQLVEVIKVLGTPTREEIRCMNPNYTDFRFPQIKAHPWHKARNIFHKRMPPEAIDLTSRLLQYSPNFRCTAVSSLPSLGFLYLEACAHPFFDELREPNARLPNGRPLPPLFNFKQEVSLTSSESCVDLG
ncbi:hypothetical protein ZIOFF_037429 [Zingiber officinale]|uniref:non-specific serine/threonine protein kinase n=1 Tax=Zingiber officinale TaxID=94328 RepID=A0A8J5GEX6_ZINOF|nr:hypothetical protein ZIOFF_037429 [Zingiber officinale]